MSNTDGESLERLNPDDEAQRTADMFIAASIAQHKLRAKADELKPGTCANCGEMCLPMAVYCDEGCREDHEVRVRTLQRLRGS